MNMLNSTISGWPIASSIFGHRERNLLVSPLPVCHPTSGFAVDFIGVTGLELLFAARTNQPFSPREYPVTFEPGFVHRDSKDLDREAGVYVCSVTSYDIHCPDK